MIVNTKYNFGDIVFLKTDPDQFERMITKIIICQECIIYGVNMGSVFSEHYDFELSSQKDLMKELNIFDIEKS